MKKILSKTDIEYFTAFMNRYPGWTILRYEDGSMEMVPPVRKEFVSAPPRRIVRV